MAIKVQPKKKIGTKDKVDRKKNRNEGRRITGKEIYITRKDNRSILIVVVKRKNNKRKENK